MEKTTISPEKILNYLEGKHDEMLSLLKKLVLAESPTDDPQAQQAVFDELGKQLKELDYYVLQMPGDVTGGYLMARPLYRKKHQKIQLLLGHGDTVWPLRTLENMPLGTENGKLKGPGVYDMKAGLTQIIFAIKTLQDLGCELPFTPVVLVNSDEEKGSRESTQAIRRLAKIAERAYIMEPPLGLQGKLKTARKGLGRFTITVKGKPAHAGLDPGKGASAILELSHQIQKLFSLNDPEKGVTVNVGMVEGGVSPNVIAPESKAVVDVRVLSHKQGNRITEVINNLKPINPETELIIEGGIGRPPLERTVRNQKLWFAAQKAGKQMGIDLDQGTAGGGSDGNTTSLFTATLDGLGTTGDGAHARHEFIFSDKLLERTALLSMLLLIR